MATAQLKLFADYEGAKFIKSGTSPDDYVFGPFAQGEIVPISLKVLARDESNPVQPYSVITDTLSCRIGIVTPGPSGSTIHTASTLAFNGATGTYSGVLNLTGAAITTLLGTSNRVETTLELEIDAAGSPRIIQAPVVLNSNGLKTGGFVPVDPVSYPTWDQARGTFMTRELPPGIGPIYETPTTGKKFVTYVGDDEQFHVEPLT